VPSLVNRNGKCRSSAAVSAATRAISTTAFGEAATDLELHVFIQTIQIVRSTPARIFIRDGLSIKQRQLTTQWSPNMSTFEFSSSEDDRIRVAPRPMPIFASAGSQRTKAGARPAIRILKTFAMLILIAISVLALRMLLSLPNGIVH
jgi:hypothetical protein